MGVRGKETEKLLEACGEPEDEAIGSPRMHSLELRHSWGIPPKNGPFSVFDLSVLLLLVAALVTKSLPGY